MSASIDAARFHVPAREFDDSINRLGSMLSVCLPLHPQIEVLVQNYFKKSPSALVPGPLVTPGLVSFAYLARRFEDGCGGTEILRQISHTILQTSCTPVHLEESLTAAQFPKLYHDAECMRLESIGLLCAIAGRSSKQRFGGSEEGRETFITTMMQCSSTCLRVTRNIATEVSDMMTWLGHEHLQLTIAVYGDTSACNCRSGNNKSGYLLIIALTQIRNVGGVLGAWQLT